MHKGTNNEQIGAKGPGQNGKRAVVAGHICLDMTPRIPEHGARTVQEALRPGQLIHVGETDIHTGGAVANTGLAMKLLGADVTLVGKTGQDAFGDMVVSIADRYGAGEGLIRKAGESTSYTVVLAVPGIDRIFLHHPGANDTFCAADLPMSVLSEASLFHFGYPTLMKRVYENGGKELIKIMRTAKEAGAATSLDLAAVDEASEAGKEDWKSILSKTLPYVDIFVPSVEELMAMLMPEKYRELRERSTDDLTEELDAERDVKPLAKLCMEMGVKILLIKCGAPGIYYQTADEKSLSAISPRLSLDCAAFAGRAGFERSFVPERVLSGTGAGDTSIAAFLTALLSGYPLERCLRYAVATGTCCVEAYDALSGLKRFPELEERIQAGWERTGPAAGL